MFPCKVGDMVYNLVPKVRKNTYREDVVSKIVFDEYSVNIYFQNGLSKDIKQIGKTFFLTKEAAEKALKEFSSNPVLGGMGGKGFGLCDAVMLADWECFCEIKNGELELCEKAEKVLCAYDQFLAENADEIISFLGAVKNE